MNIRAFAKDSKKISILAMFIIFLALIRCISEPFRLQHYSERALTLVDIKPFLMGALVTSVALLIMTMLSLFYKYRIITATSILTIVVLLVLKGIYMVP